MIPPIRAPTLELLLKSGRLCHMPQCCLALILASHSPHSEVPLVCTAFCLLRDSDPHRPLHSLSFPGCAAHGFRAAFTHPTPTLVCAPHHTLLRCCSCSMCESGLPTLTRSSSRSELNGIHSFIHLFIHCGTRRCTSLGH